MNKWINKYFDYFYLTDSEGTANENFSHDGQLDIKPNPCTDIENLSKKKKNNSDQEFFLLLWESILFEVTCPPSKMKFKWLPY